MGLICATCGTSIANDQEAVASVYRNVDGRIRGQEAKLHHRACFANPHTVEGDIEVLRGYPVTSPPEV